MRPTGLINSDGEGIAMSFERPWLAQYPQGVPAQIDVDEFPSVVDVLQNAIDKYRDRPAFANLGKTLTYADRRAQLAVRRLPAG